MSGRTATWIGVTLAVFTAVNFGLFLAAGQSSGPASAVTAFIAIMSYAIVGTLVVGRHPGNPLAWIFCIAPFFVGLSCGSQAYFESGSGTWPAARAFGLLSDTGWTLALGIPAAYLGLLIPDGRLPSPRWRPVAWIAAVLIACGVIGTIFGESTIDDRIANPMYVSGVQSLFSIAAIGLLALLATGVAAVAIRYRRGSVVERQQLKWILAAFVVMIGFGVAGVATTLLEAVWFASWALLPIAFAISIFRYRLYEIDVIIRRTIVYATLVASLALIYFAGISLIEHVLQALTGQSSALAVTISTLAVAAGFQPLRSRIQRAVDHRFYRRKYDSSQTVGAFTARLRDQIDLDSLQCEVLAAVQTTVQPRHASLWLRRRDGGYTG